MDNQFNSVPKKRPVNHLSQPQPQPQSSVQSIQDYHRQQYQEFQNIPEPPPPQPLQDQVDLHDSKPPKKKSRLKWVLLGFAIVLLAALSLIAAGYMWYQSQLQPYDSANQEKVAISIEDGMVASQVADRLEERQVINSAIAMKIYLRLNNLGGSLKSGVYSISPSQPMSQIVDHLLSGQPDQRAITFFPGAMLEDNSNTPEPQKTDVKSVLKRAGYTDADIDKAFQDSYTSPVLADRPSSASLEGYIYGETYFVDSAASVKQILQGAIDELAKVVEQNNLKDKFKQRGLSLHEGIILASIVHRESIGCPGQSVCKDQQDIASVFYNRLDSGMNLGSDVTYHYVADRDGIARNFNIDSPYNTRRYPGLPPGPIASPGISALNAVADPSETDYMYFLSGDDDITYFGRTNEDHEANIRNHCHEKCLLP